MRVPAPKRSTFRLLAIMPPRLRIEKFDSKPRHATWLELFYDLVFVVAVSQLAHRLSDDVTVSGFISYAGLFVPIWWAWIGTTFYANRFDSDDIVRRVMMSLQMLAIAALAVNVHHAWGDTSMGFALSYIVSRVLLIIEYLRAAKHIPEARSLTYPMSIGFSIGVSLWIVSLFVPAPLRFVFWFAGLLVDFIMPLVASTGLKQLPPHAEHLPERFGLFTIIVLGEAIIAVVNGISEISWSLGSAIAAALGFVVAFGLWWLYFENSLGKALEKARDTGRLLVAQVWLYGHLPLVIGLAAAGIGVEHIVVSEPGMPLPENERWLMAGSVAICYVALAILHRTGVIFACKARTRHRLAGAAAALAIALFGTLLSPVAVIGAIAFIGIVEVIFDIYQKPIPIANDRVER